MNSNKDFFFFFFNVMLSCGRFFDTPPSPFNKYNERRILFNLFLNVSFRLIGFSFEVNKTIYSQHVYFTQKFQLENTEISSTLSCYIIQANNNINNMNAICGQDCYSWEFVIKFKSTIGIIVIVHSIIATSEFKLQPLS